MDVGCYVVTVLECSLAVRCFRSVLVRIRCNHPGVVVWYPGYQPQEDCTIGTHCLRDRPSTMGKGCPPNLPRLLLPCQHHCYIDVDFGWCRYRPSLDRYGLSSCRFLYSLGKFFCCIHPLCCLNLPERIMLIWLNTLMLLVSEITSYFIHYSFPRFYI